MATGRERQHDVIIAGVPFMALRTNGLAQWSVQAVPKIAGDALQIAEEQREQTTWVRGFGYQRFGGLGGYDYCDGVDTRGLGEIKLGPLVTTFAASGAVTGFFRIGTAFYVLASRYCQQIDLDDDHCETPNDGAAGKDFGAGAAASAAILFDGSARIGFSTNTVAWSFNGTTWTQATTQSIKATYWARYWSPNAKDYVLARNIYNTKQIDWLAQGATFDSTDWGADYDIGDTSQVVTGMVGARLQPWIAKKDGLYYIDTDGEARPVLDGIPLDDNNGAQLDCDIEGLLWYPGRQLVRYNPLNGVAEVLTPGRGLSHDSTIYGRVTCHKQYGVWHFAWVYNGTNSYLMAGRDTDFGFIWHGALAKVASATVTCMEVCTATSPPRLYFGAGTSVYYIRLEEPMRYAASGSIYFSADNMGVAGTRWSLAGFVIDNDGLSSATYAELYANLDGGGWQRIGRANTRGQTFVPIPTSGDWRCSAFSYRLDFTNASSTSSPRVFGVTARATRRPSVRDLIHTVLHCSEQAKSHYGMSLRMSGADQLSHLKELLGQGPVELKDYWSGHARTQRVIVTGARDQLVKEHGWDEAAAAAEVTMVCQSSETVSTEAGAIATYGSAVYGTDRYS